jgi:hypothetical protein
MRYFGNTCDDKTVENFLKEINADVEPEKAFGFLNQSSK